MLLRYTDGHPDVLNTRRIIKEAEAQRDQERKRLVEEQERRRRAAGPPEPTRSTRSSSSRWPSPRRRSHACVRG
jgi:hypothetical protein